MDAKVVQFGDALAVVLDPEVLRRLHIGPGTRLQVTTEGDSIILTVADDQHRAELEAIMDEMDEQYAPVFKRLTE